jgi:hypothetical protein
MEGVNEHGAGMGAATPIPAVTVTEATEVAPQPSPNNNENHTRPKRTRKESTELVLRQGDDHPEQWRFMPVMSIDKALERRQTIVGSAQEFDGSRILSRFLEDHEFGPGGRHALRLE